MALIIDPDLLTESATAAEITITVATKLITLTATGNLSTDGVTIKCVYSKLKELWRSNSTYIKYAFPMGPITDEQFEMINGWDWAGNSTRYLLRTGGWAKKDANGISEQEWTGVITLGSIGASDQAYFWQTSSGSATTNFQLTGPVNQTISVYSSAGSYDYRSYLKVACRIYQKSYALSTLSDIGVSTLTYQVYRFPLANAADIKITHDDNALSAAPYSGMSITWAASAYSRNIGGTTRYFTTLINGNNGTAEEIYEFVQKQLRQATDIDAGTDPTTGVQYGERTPLILRFVGDTLYTILLTTSPSGGVFIDNYQTADINRLVFVDNSNAERTFPYTANLTVNFGDNLKADTSSKYWVFFTDVPSGNYGDSDAILVNDASTVPMTGWVSGSSSVQRTFDYDVNTQGGRTSGSDAPITAVALGLSGAQFVKATTTIARSTANSVSLVSAIERNYQNPA